jgi:hypothetical protein
MTEFIAVIKDRLDSDLRSVSPCRTEIAENAVAGSDICSMSHINNNWNVYDE